MTFLSPLQRAIDFYRNCSRSELESVFEKPRLPDFHREAIQVLLEDPEDRIRARHEKRATAAKKSPATRRTKQTALRVKDHDARRAAAGLPPLVDRYRSCSTKELRRILAQPGLPSVDVVVIRSLMK